MVDTNAFVESVARRVVKRLTDADDRDRPVVRHSAPETIEAELAALGVPIALDATDAPRDLPALEAAMDAVERWSVQTLHPRFFNQNFAGADPVAVAADWLGATLNTTQATYEVAPVFTLMERAVIGRVAELAGWGTHDGLFVAGGSVANIHALHAARHRICPQARRLGNPTQRLVAFGSAHAHYSLQKGMALLGLGSDSAITVPVDERGRMRIDALAAALDRAEAVGDRPFFVQATAATTVIGAFDPIAEISDLAAAHGAWCHVDGCIGAGALLSPRERGRLAGVERADSLAWNLHKMMGLTQQCAVVLTRHPPTPGRSLWQSRDRRRARLSHRVPPAGRLTAHHRAGDHEPGTANRTSPNDSAPRPHLSHPPTVR